MERRIVGKDGDGTDDRQPRDQPKKRETRIAWSASQRTSILVAGETKNPEVSMFSARAEPVIQVDPATIGTAKS